jgi:hypothetical protein
VFLGRDLVTGEGLPGVWCESLERFSDLGCETVVGFGVAVNDIPVLLPDGRNLDGRRKGRAGRRCEDCSGRDSAISLLEDVCEEYACDVRSGRDRLEEGAKVNGRGRAGAIVRVVEHAGDCSRSDATSGEDEQEEIEDDEDGVEHEEGYPVSQ